MRKLKYIIISSSALMPFLAFAQGQPRTLIDLINRFVEILSAFIPFLFGIALIGFLWGVAQFILKADDEEKRKQGKLLMIWGIIGLFVMVGVWGLVGVISGTFGINVSPGSVPPQLPGQGHAPFQDFLNKKGPPDTISI